MRTKRLFPLLVFCAVSFALPNARTAAQQVVVRGAGASLLPTSAPANSSSNGTGANSAPDAPLPSPKDLLAKNDEVMGGREAWNKATTRRMKGLYQTEDNSTFFSIEILQKTPNKSLYKITLPNEMIVRDVCDGHSAWVEDAVGGYHEFYGAALTSRLRRSEFLDRGKAFLLMTTGKVTGIEKIGKHNAYVVEYVPEKNVASRLYFDVESGFLVHTEDVYTTPDGPYSMKLDLDDYRTVDGLMFPYRMKLTEKGMVLNIRITQASVNAPLDDALFLKPESAPK